MKTASTYKDLLAENIALKTECAAVKSECAAVKEQVDAMRANELHLKRRIAYLERISYGPKSDKILSKVPSDQPGLFDDFFKEAMDEKAAEIERTAAEIEKETQKRRTAAKSKSSRPARYLYEGLEEHLTTIMPEGVDPKLCDVIGKNVVRMLHRDPAKLWVEVIERPILRLKSDKNALSSRIYQAKAPKPIIGGNHVGAD